MEIGGVATKHSKVKAVTSVINNWKYPVISDGLLQINAVITAN